MANDDSKTQKHIQQIPLSKIHELPGIIVPQQPDRAYGGLVSSIQSHGVTIPVILRLREDGEYQMVEGYRRRRACELAKRQDIPAQVYEMTVQEALSYRQKQKLHPETPVPGKLIPPPATEKSVVQPVPPSTAPGKVEEKDGKTPPAADTPSDKGKEKKEPPAAPGTAPGKAEEKDGKTPPAVDTPLDKGKEKKEPPAAPGTAPGKAEEKDGKTPPAVDTPPDKGKEKKEPPAAPGTAPGKAEGKDGKTPPAADTPPDKGKEKKEPPVVSGSVPGKVVEFPKKEAPAVAPAARGPVGTAITKIFEDRCDPPDEKALSTLPIPEKEGESYFITLHPAYLEKSKFNNFSIDQESDNFKELFKAIELAGIKDPVLARPKEGGGLEILSGQRRHMIGKMLNYPIPTIIQKIDDDDAKIIVADCNLHRDKISSYDLSRALRMKMDGMKRKAGRRRKNDPTIPKLNTDEQLAKEMGMTVSKLNRLIRLSEATKEVCNAYDQNEIELSIANALSFLTPEHQTQVLDLRDLGYKITTARVERLKPLDAAGKLTEQLMRDVLDDKDLIPKIPPQAPTMPTAPATPANPPAPAAPSAAPAAPAPQVTPPPPAEPLTPPVPTAGAVPALAPGGTAGISSGGTPAGTPPTEIPPEDDVFKGKQERPENMKVILTGDRLRKYYPDVTMTPREIEEDIYGALEERRQRQEKQKAKEEIFKRPKDKGR